MRMRRASGNGWAGKAAAKTRARAADVRMESMIPWQAKENVSPPRCLGRGRHVEPLFHLQNTGFQRCEAGDYRVCVAFHQGKPLLVRLSERVERLQELRFAVAELSLIH